ncbi:XRE family transcriptional regulator [Streptomyces xanthochromogenes]|uniref:XRE family transcriptional regulator n=1 Tax=Streptomyces xanthochromogenes TaxID=67384 RepID=UPI0034447E23
MSTVLRKDDGKPLRAAMQAAGLSGPKLAAATTAVDPQGIGISPAKVGRLTTMGKSAQAVCRRRTAELIAVALAVPLEQLFTPPVSTDTVERSSPDADSR